MGIQMILDSLRTNLEAFQKQISTKKELPPKNELEVLLHKLQQNSRELEKESLAERSVKRGSSQAETTRIRASLKHLENFIKDKGTQDKAGALQAMLKVFEELQGQLQKIERMPEDEKAKFGYKVKKIEGDYKGG